MEINPKFWGSVELALEAGVDFASDLVRVFRGQPSDYSECYDRQLHFYWPLDGDLVHLVRTWQPGKVREYFAPHARTNLGYSHTADVLKALRTCCQMVTHKCRRRGDAVPGNHALPLPLLARLDHHDRPHHRGGAAGVAGFPALTDHDTTAGRGNWPAGSPRRAAAGGPAGRRISHRSRRPDRGLHPRGNCLAGRWRVSSPRCAVRGASSCCPIPWSDHRDPEMLAGRADLVEVFNGRAGDAANQAAAELAARVGKPGFWASDAHLACSLAADRRDGGKPGPAQGLASARRHPAGGAAGLPSPATCSCPKSSKSSRPGT